MPVIKGFHGLRYDTRIVRRAADVLAPPYDVISPKEQAAFYKKNPYNVIRLELGLEKKSDGPADNKYTRAGRFLNEWKASGVLKAEREPSLYIYVQDYKEAGKARRRIGFLAAMKVDKNAVLKHENTLAAPKKDRLALLKEVRTNLSPIWGLYDDRNAAVRRLLTKAAAGTPVVDTSIDGVRHRLYVAGDDRLVGAVSAAMKNKPMFIADGHHRFEVACQYKDWMGSRAPKDPEAEWNYVMTYFSDFSHNPFTIWPTHRLVKAPKAMKDPLAALALRGKLEKIKGLPAILKLLGKTRKASGDSRYRFGIYSKKKGFYLLTLDNKLSKKVKNGPVDRLDVAVLHHFLIEPCFGIRAIEKSDAIDFTRDAKAAVEKVNGGQFDLALFLRPTSLDEMLEASRKGLKMPQKSTYFYPKLLSGLVFHSLEDGAPACCCSCV